MSFKPLTINSLKTYCSVLKNMYYVPQGADVPAQACAAQPEQLQVRHQAEPLPAITPGKSTTTFRTLVHFHFRQ